MLDIYQGRGHTLEGALAGAVGASPAPYRLVIVPRQLTLQTEQMLLGRLGLPGAFDLQVMSTERLCARLFEASGTPEGERVDERGRVMLVRAAIRAARDALTVYRGAERRRGFSELAADQLEKLRQAHLSPEQIRDYADTLGGTAALRLGDLAAILEKYMELTEGRYLDGETELISAAAGCGRAAFLRDSAVWFYGYDLVPPTLYELMAALSCVCRETGVFMPLPAEEDTADADCFLPLKRARDRLCAQVRAAGGTARIKTIPEDAGPSRHPDLSHLERELFAWPPKSSDRAAKAISLVEPGNVREECMMAAALARRLARTRKWRWNDIQLLVSDPEAYAEPLAASFAAYGIPLVMSVSRSAARFSVSECLFTALCLLEKRAPQEEMLALLAAGFLPLETDEAERYANHIVRQGLKGSMFFRPLRRGAPEEIQAMEPLRERAAAPILRLREALRASRTLTDQLTALFGFLQELRAAETLQAKVNALSAAGERERAHEVSQVWNRLIGAMDQLNALMGPEKLSLEELRLCLSESLSASPVKALPQSGDAVYAQSVEVSSCRQVRALLILGLSDRRGSAAAGLLTQEQIQALARLSDRYLGPDDQDLSRMRRYYLKAAIGTASDYVCISCPSSGPDGSAQRPSGVFRQVQTLFPGTPLRGGLKGDAGIDRMLRGAAGPAVTFAGRALSEEAEGIALPEPDRAALACLFRLGREDESVARALGMLKAALRRSDGARDMSPDTARKLYLSVRSESVTSLERFAQCPFSYFAQYGLQPELLEPYQYRANDEGIFLHEAVRIFMQQSRDDLQVLDPAQAGIRMRAIAQGLLETQLEQSALGDTALSRAESRRLLATAETCAVMLTAQMRGSLFANTALERSFGPRDGDAALRLADGSVLIGKIDRVDTWTSDFAGDGQRDYLRVIDYKRSGKRLRLGEVYLGLSFQLPVYLAAAMRLGRGRSAGVYYFPLTEGIADSQSTDPAEVEAERRKLFRMEGLLPEERELQAAISPNLSDVLQVQTSASGELYKNTLTAARGDYERLIRHVLEQAGKTSKDIRSGRCAASPVRLEKDSACKRCAYRGICLFDEKMDASRVRRYRKLSDADALAALARDEKLDNPADK